MSQGQIPTNKGTSIDKGSYEYIERTAQSVRTSSFSAKISRLLHTFNASQKESQNQSCKLLELFRAHNICLNSIVNCNAYFYNLHLNCKTSEFSIVGYENEKPCWGIIYLGLWYRDHRS